MPLDTRIPLMGNQLEVQQVQNNRLAQLAQQDIQKKRLAMDEQAQGQQMQMNEEQMVQQRLNNLSEREKSRFSSTVYGAAEMMAYLEGGDIDGAKSFAQTRKRNLEKRRAAGEDIDTRETDAAIKMLDENPEALKKSLGQLLQVGQMAGILKPVAPTEQDGMSAGAAQALGVPAIPVDTRGMSGKDASMYTKQSRLAAEKRLQHPDNIDAQKKARANLADVTRFKELQTQQPTGGWRNIVPDAVLEMDDEMGEMQAISKRLTPQQRVPGSGATSDFDARMFKGAIFDVNKPAATNTNIAAALEAANKDEQNYQSFLSDYMQANGHLNGADKAWQKYVDENPIFDRTSTTDNLTLNTKRKTYQEYFNGGQTTQPKGIEGAEETKVIGGVEYHKVNGKWVTQ